MSEWQPIEIAPKGTVLIARKSGEVRTAWAGEHGVIAEDTGYRNRIYDATHWMPLPEPPEETEA